MTGDATRAMDGIIERTLHNEASAAELAALTAWRRAARGNEQHYNRTARLIEAARALGSRDVVVPPRPSAASIAARVHAGRGRALVAADTVRAAAAPKPRSAASSSSTTD